MAKSRKRGTAGMHMAQNIYVDRACCTPVSRFALPKINAKRPEVSISRLLNRPSPTPVLPAMF